LLLKKVLSWQYRYGQTIISNDKSLCVQLDLQESNSGRDNVQCNIQIMVC
jgi:hypothetical protein